MLGLHAHGQGLSNTKIHKAWCRIKDKPKAWRTFAAFRRAMGDPPARARLVRRDLTKPHSRTNSYWATPGDQQQALRALIERSVMRDAALKRVREAKDRGELIDAMAAAKEEHSFTVIGVAARLSRQRVQQVLAASPIPHNRASRYA
jgi:hypothetical protein